MVSRPSQFNLGLSSAEAMAACGPAAAIAFAQAYGRNPTASEAIQLARNVGWSTSGMKGPGSEQQLLASMGINTKLTNGVDWNAVGQEANTGNPVIVSTPGHYYFIDGYNAANGSYHVGTSGTDLKSGADWMTPNQMQSLMGSAQGALFADHPLQGPSSQVQSSPQQQPQNMGYQSAYQRMMGIPGYGSSGGGGGFQTMPFSGQPGSIQTMPYNGGPLQSSDLTLLSQQYAGKPYVNEAIMAAQQAGIDPKIFLKQINQESGFNPNAGSAAGARGIAQIVPQYHPGVNTADPVASLNYAANLDKQLLTQYGGDYTKALVAYNGGGGAVNAWNSGQPYSESKAYVNAILSGEAPASFSGQPQSQNGIQPQTQGQQAPQGSQALKRLFQMGGLGNSTIGNMLNYGNNGPSILSQALSNPYMNTPPPTATPNPMNLFSSVFTG